MKQIIKDDILNKSYTVYNHKSGLTVYMFKTPGFSSYHATFGTNYGSIDNVFSYNNESYEVPHGIAHFLEHKMFECDDGDAFLKFSKTGAYSNAYTSFDKTCYLFSCSKNFYENLDILLDFVSRPYFTNETVLKEQGIIGQEITMYDDMPSWRVFHNLLECLYKDHPIRIDIPGTKETIAKITPELLYKLHEVFYTPSNMYLCIAGDIDEDKVIEIVDKNIKKPYTAPAKSTFKKESNAVFKKEAKQNMEVAKPLFALGFKINESLSSKELRLIELLLKILVGPCSPLYKKLLDAELIDDDFGAELLYGRGFSSIVFEGASEKPQKVCEEIFNEIENLKQQGFDENLFNAVKKEMIGSLLRQFNSPESICGLLLDAAFKKEEPFSLIKELKAIKSCDVKNAFCFFNKESSALSIINTLSR